MRIEGREAGKADDARFAAACEDAAQQQYHPLHRPEGKKGRDQEFARILPWKKPWEKAKE